MDWNDPAMYWLNITNIGLGLVTLACLMVLGYGVLRQFAGRAKAPVADAHALAVPELGLTMADGGEPLENRNPKQS